MILRDYSVRVLGDAGTEFRCNVDFLRTRLRQTLDEPQVSLAQQTRYVLAGPSGHLLVQPSLASTWDGRDHETFFQKSNLTTIEAEGYDFRAKNNGLKLVVLGQDGKERDETRTISGHHLLQAPVDFRRDRRKVPAVRSTAYPPGPKVTSSKFRSPGRPIVPPVYVAPLPPRVASVIVHIDTTDDDKDREIRFTYSVRQGNTVLASTTVGDGEVWKDHPPDHREYTLPIPEAQRFTEEDRFGDALHVQVRRK